MIRQQRLVLHPWNAPQPLAVEQALPLPVRPYVDDLYLPPVIRPSGDGGHARLRVWMLPAKARLHSELSTLTDVWVYRESNVAPPSPQMPVGPTIEVRQDQHVQIDWVNALHAPGGGFATHPVVAVHDLPAYVQFADSGDIHATENLLGFALGQRDHSVAQMPPWTVVHLHGGRTTADYDGWPETGYYPGQVQTTVYTNQQPGALLWYHDHGMAITRLNVYAGLAGLYIIRDPREDELRLPRGAPDHELLLLVQDRALTVDGDPSGTLPAQLLHKTGTAGGEPISIDGGAVDQAPMEFFGPLTLVNGRIWPRVPIHADVYRLRILNASNARTYRLRFTDADGRPVPVPLQMIGSDGGLLARPLDLNDGSIRPDPGSLPLAPAERADVLVDFRGLSGRRVELRNFAASPFQGKDADPENPLGDLLPYPHVMCFDVGAPGERHRFLPWDQPLLPSATPWPYDAVRRLNPVERIVALVEGDDGVLQLMECAPLSDETGQRCWDGSSPVPPTQLALRQPGEPRHRLYGLLPSMFSETVRYLARDGDVEIWKLINLSPDTHPIHLHLVRFKLVARDAYSPIQRLRDPSGSGAGGYETHADVSRGAVRLDPADLGWKDTIRVDPGQMAIVAVPFRAYAAEDVAPEQGTPLHMTGRYMYHCHILEHEDHEMMRPYVVMPPEVIDHMHHAGRTMHGHGNAAVPSSSGWYMPVDLRGVASTGEPAVTSSEPKSAITS